MIIISQNKTTLPLTICSFRELPNLFALEITRAKIINQSYINMHSKCKFNGSKYYHQKCENKISHNCTQCTRQHAVAGMQSRMSTQQYDL